MYVIHIIFYLVPSNPALQTYLYQLRDVLKYGIPRTFVEGISSYNPTNYGLQSEIEGEDSKFQKEFRMCFGDNYVVRCPKCKQISVGVHSLCTDCCIKTNKVVPLFECKSNTCPVNMKNCKYNPDIHLGYICQHTGKKPLDGFRIRSIVEAILLPLYFLPGKLYNTKRTETLRNIYHCANIRQCTWFNCVNKCSAYYHRGEFQLPQRLP